LDPDPKKRTDEELLKASREGNISAFEELVRRYEPKVARTVVSMLGPVDEADDVGQETFVRFYYGLKHFRGEASIGTYITRIAINLSLNELKRRERRRSIFKRIETGSRNDEPAADNVLHHFEDREIIRNAMEKLNPKFRAVVTLRLIEGYSTRETADILRLPIGTVLSRLKRAQEKLQSILRTYKEGFL